VIAHDLIHRANLKYRFEDTYDKQKQKNQRSGKK
jgi:hypothetical protein